jgi:hypothetical protein
MKPLKQKPRSQEVPPKLNPSTISHYPADVQERIRTRFEMSNKVQADYWAWSEAQAKQK